MISTATDWITNTRARYDAATPGMWEHETAEFRDQRSHCVRTPDADDWNGVVAHTGYGPDGSRAEADAEFITAARTDLPVALDALSAVLALCDRWSTTKGNASPGQMSAAIQIRDAIHQVVYP